MQAPQHFELEFFLEGGQPTGHSGKGREGIQTRYRHAVSRSASAIRSFEKKIRKCVQRMNAEFCHILEILKNISAVKGTIQTDVVKGSPGRVVPTATAAA
jgi:hypothetical protein